MHARERVGTIDRAVDDVAFIGQDLRDDILQCEWFEERKSFERSH